MLCTQVSDTGPILVVVNRMSSLWCKWNTIKVDFKILGLSTGYTGKHVCDQFSKEIVFLCWDKTLLNLALLWENLFMPYANNEGADQPAHQRSLISTFFVRCLDSMIPLVSISEIASLYLASVAEQAGLRLTCSQTPKPGFLMTRLLCY